MLALHLLQSALVLVNTTPRRSGPHRTRLGQPDDRPRSPRPDPIVLVQRRPPRHLVLDLDKRIDYARSPTPVIAAAP